MASDQLPHPESAPGSTPGLHRGYRPPPPHHHRAGPPVVGTLPCARIPFPRGAGKREAPAGFTTYAWGWHRRSPLGSSLHRHVGVAGADRRSQASVHTGFGAKEKPKSFYSFPQVPAPRLRLRCGAPAGRRLWDRGVQIPVPEMVGTMMGTWPSAWQHRRHERQERAEQDAPCGARPRRCQRSPQHPILGAVLAAIFAILAKK